MIETIGVIGSGQMGSGIAQVCAQAGYSVVLFDVAPAQLVKARANMERSLRKLAEKACIEADSVEAALAKIKTTTS